MTRCEKLLQKAIAAPKSLSFRELCKLATRYGFELTRVKGSHHIYKCPGYPEVMNFQPDRNGGAKLYQVRALLDAIDDLQ